MVKQAYLRPVNIVIILTLTIVLPLFKYRQNYRLQAMLCQDSGPTHVGPIGLFPHQPLGLHIVPTLYSLHGKNASNIYVIVNIY